MNGIIKKATIDDMKRGYVWNPDECSFMCISCGKALGEEPDQAASHAGSHGGMLAYLLGLDREHTGMTDLQKEFMRLSLQGLSHKDIAERMNISPSTVRNMLYALKARARQARTFLSAFELFEEAAQAGARGKMKRFPKREKSRVELLPRFASLFEAGRKYSEEHVKRIIKGVYDDDALIRRYLIEYGFMARSNDGSEYWRLAGAAACHDGGDIKITGNPGPGCKEKNESPHKEAGGKSKKGRDKVEKSNRKDMIRSYKEQDVEMGILKITNTASGLSYIMESTNLYEPFNGIKFQLRMGLFRDRKVQKDFSELGEDSFTFDVVSKLDMKEGWDSSDKLIALGELRERWIRENSSRIRLY